VHTDVDDCLWYKSVRRCIVALVDQLGLFASNVKSMREARAISQEELAFAAGIHRTHLSKIERRECEPGVTILARLAQALDLPAGPLLERGGE
jgi:transcriptional regulator with XRE-family HTH domain